MSRAELSNLRQLVSIITENVDAIERLAKKQGVEHPTIDTSYDPESEPEKFTVKPEVLEAAMLATSAASQLIATLKLPGLTLLDRANAFHIPSALRIASETCTVELLREAGPKGMHVDEIAAKTSTNPTVIGRSLRLLATHYVFREIDPNVFVNNRISSMMDTGKSSESVLALARIKREHPIKGHGVSNVQGGIYADTNGVSALVQQCTDELFKSSAFLPEVVLTNNYTNTPFQKAMQSNASMWDFLDRNPGYLQRIQMAIVAWSYLQPQQRQFNGFDWSKLPADSLVIDVGGGNGSESFEIATKAPHLKIMIQDRDKTIQQITTPTWINDEARKKLITSGRVKLISQDFFEEQPAYLTNTVSVYYLRFITHDWPSPECVTILKQLHAAASPTTKLLLVDRLVPYACPSPATYSKIRGMNPVRAPTPLLANLGQVNSDVYATDFTMAALFNGQERTLGEFIDITGKAGWKIEEVFQILGSSLSQIVCVKA